MRVLWVSVAWPAPLDSGGAIRARQTLAALQAVADHVTVLGLAPPGAVPALAGPTGNLQVVDPVPWEVRIRRRPGPLAAAVARAARTGASYRFAKFDSPGLAAVLDRHLDGHDLLYVGHLPTMAAVERAGPDRLPPIVLEAHNVEHRVALEAAAARTGASSWARPLLAAEARRLEGEERRALARAAAVVAISEPDRRRLLEMGARHAVVVPPVAAPVVEPSGPGTEVLVLGNLGWPPTAAGLAEQLPGWRRWPLPEPPVVIGQGAGRQLVRAIGRAGLRHVGYVADLEPWWRRARVVVVPGGGTGARMRFLDAFRHGRPVVATAAAAEGIDGGDAVLVVDRPGLVPAAVARVISDDDLARHMGAAALERAATHHGPGTAAEAMAAVVAAACGQPSATR